MNDSCCISLALLELPKWVLSSVMVEFLCTRAHTHTHTYILVAIADIMLPSSHQ